MSIYVIAMTLWILIEPKGAESITCFQLHTPFWNEIFKWITKLGEWFPLTCLGIFLLIKNRKGFLAALIAFLPINILMNTMKKVLNYPRPLSYFKHGEIYPITDYVRLYEHSMPSGHTFTAFFVASFCCTFYSIDRRIQTIIFLLACLGGFSRIYLLCHFKEDVLAGSLLGIFAGMMPIFIYDKWLEKK